MIAHIKLMDACVKKADICSAILLVFPHMTAEILREL